MSKLQWMLNYISVILQSEPTKYLSLFILTGASLLRNAVWYDGEILHADAYSHVQNICWVLWQ